jgi:hypothetical protein
MDVARASSQEGPMHGIRYVLLLKPAPPPSCRRDDTSPRQLPGGDDISRTGARIGRTDATWSCSAGSSATGRAVVNDQLAIVCPRPSSIPGSPWNARKPHTRPSMALPLPDAG